MFFIRSVPAEVADEGTEPSILMKHSCNVFGVTRKTRSN